MKTLKPILAIAAVLALGAGVYGWWKTGQLYPSTDDAILQANIISIGPQVGGAVATVAVAENAYVKAGDVLFTLDSANLQAAEKTAQAQLDLAVLGTGATGANVAAAQANATAAAAALQRAETDLARNKALFTSGAVAQAALDQVQLTRDQTAAAKQAADAAVAAAIDQAGAGKAPAVQAAQGVLTQAQLALSHATVTAPANGWVSNIALRPGQVVAAGQPLFSLVEDHDWWVEGNFKETDLSRIRPGQPVSISIDMYPGVKLTGKVDSLGSGSGAVFSLLPAQNATGNWVKVTQRFPVRIALDPQKTDSAVQLRVGASVTATVDTSVAP